MHVYGQPCVYERLPGAASAPLPAGYRPRAGPRSDLHRVVREHLESFLAEGRARSESGEGYPYYVEKELRDLLGCGDMWRGFARLRCKTCGHELLVPLSCKGRSICPSCTGRRMADEAAFLVDVLLPECDYRQWTLTFPWPIRYQMAKDYKLITAILGISIRCLFSWQRKMARRAGYRDAKTAAVTFVQRFGGAMNSHVHFHILLPDAVFVSGPQADVLDVLALPPPTEKDLLALLQRLVRRVDALCQQRFGTVEDCEDEPLQGAISEAMRNLPLTVEADQGSVDELPDQQEPRRTRTSRRCAWLDGYSLHANTRVPAHNRTGLEKLCRYGLRPALAQDRVSLTKDGRVRIDLQKPWPRPDGTSALILDGVQFLRRLAPLIPPPFANLVRHHGLFAPRAKLRDALPPAPVSPQGLRLEAELRISSTSRAAAKTPEGQGPAVGSADQPSSPSGQPAPALAAASQPSTPTERSAPAPPAAPGAAQPEKPPARPRRTVLSWADLLRRVFLIDVMVCGRCGGPMTVLAYLTDPKVVSRILTHLKLPAAPPSPAPARLPAQLDFEQLDPRDHVSPDGEPAPRWSSASARTGPSRAPPLDPLDPSAERGDDDWAA